jgi:hypothetical protein
MQSRHKSKSSHAQHSPERGKHEPGSDTPALAERQDIAEHLARMLPELARLADRADMTLTAYFLRMAQQDVQDQLSATNQ